MRSCMADSAHDREHVYRVLYTALDIAKTEDGVDGDVLICACLLHDIGRQAQFADPTLDHAEVGGEMAFDFLLENGFEIDFAERVRHCILAHRFRRSDPPVTVEARILFDADKLDVAGALGMARSLIYIGTVGEPLYSIAPDGSVSDGTGDTEPSFFQEYKFKLENLYSRFYTRRGSELALERRGAAVDFFERLYSEVNTLYVGGKAELETYLE